MARRAIKPESEIDKDINGHTLRAEKWGGRWLVIVCPSWPDLAKQHEGAENVVELIDEFEKRAQAATAVVSKQEAQPTLLDMLNDAPNAPHLRRVRDRIGGTVLAFLRERLANGAPEFTAAELRAYVSAAHGAAPASPDRVLRALRQSGECCYEVVNRRQSRYRVVSVVVETQGEAA